MDCISNFQLRSNIDFPDVQIFSKLFGKYAISFHISCNDNSAKRIYGKLYLNTSADFNFSTSNSKVVDYVWERSKADANGLMVVTKILSNVPNQDGYVLKADFNKVIKTDGSLCNQNFHGTTKAVQKDI